MAGKEKIISMVKELAQEMQEQGYDFMMPDIKEGFGSMSIYLHNNDLFVVEFGAKDKYYRIEGK